MKKYIALLLCMVLLLSVTACGNDAPKDADTTASSTTQSTTTTTVGEGSTTATDGGAATTTTTAGSAAPSADGTATTPTTSATTATKAPTSSATGSQPTTGVGSTPSSSASTTVTTTVATPDVVLPAIGSDIDVTGKKDRIRVSEASSEYNPDGTIAVTLTFKNYSSSWITEETDYILYTCYDKDGNVAQNTTKLNIGCIDTKKHVQRTFTFTVPANTAEVRITRSKIVYWTEWS